MATIVYDQNSPDMSNPRSCVVLGTSAEGVTNVLHSNRVITPPTFMRVSNTKGGNGRSGADNNALRGHMIPVPLFGFGHCSPERRFCLVVVNHLNNAVGHCLPQPRLCISILQGGPNTLSILSRVHSSRYTFVFGFLFQASVSLGQSYLPSSVITAVMLTYIRFPLLPTCYAPAPARTPSRFHLDITIAGRFTFHVHAPSRISDFISVFSLLSSR